MIEFGSKWVKIKDEVFYMSEYEIEALKIWYNYSVKNEEPMSDEERAKLMEYFVMGLELLNPRNRGEALRFIAKLEYLYEETGDTAVELIDRMFMNKLLRETEVTDE